MSTSPYSYTVGTVLNRCFSVLHRNNISTARLDCLVLAEDITGKDRAWLLAHPEHILLAIHVRKLQTAIEKRAMHIPLSYIRGKTEFYGREFIINPSVLEPRPESETMIDMLKESVTLMNQVRPLRLVDIGTGSGALAITAKLELPRLEVVATDIDPACLRVTKANAKKHEVQITLQKANLLKLPDSNHSSPDIVLANLPYVPDSYTLNEAAMNEPHHAIFGGPDGLDLYRKLFDQLETKAVYYVLTESLPFQHKTLDTIAQNHGYKQVNEEDFVQVFQKV